MKYLKKVHKVKISESCGGKFITYRLGESPVNYCVTESQWQQFEAEDALIAAGATIAQVEALIDAVRTCVREDDAYSQSEDQ